jgi:hypothetical protein
MQRMLGLFRGEMADQFNQTGTGAVKIMMALGWGPLAAPTPPPATLSHSRDLQ